MQKEKVSEIMEIFKKLRAIMPELSMIIIFQVFLLGLIFINHNIQNINKDINSMRDISIDYEFYSIELDQSPLTTNESVAYHNRAIMLRNEIKDLENYIGKAEQGLYICEISFVFLALSFLPLNLNEMKEKYNNPHREYTENSNKKIKIYHFLFIYGSIIWIIGFLLTQPFPIIDYTPYK